MIRRTVLPAALALTGALVLSACGSDSGESEAEPAGGSKNAGLTVEGAFVPEPVNDKMAGGFLTVRNDDDTDDKLVAVTSDLSDDVQLHETVDNKMRQVESFDVPANGELELSRGGAHVMFLELKRELAEGDTVEIELEFEESDPVRVEMPVEARTHQPHDH